MGKQNKVVIFDSGVGGLNVYRQFKALYPHIPVCYLADQINMPYGGKTVSELEATMRELLPKYFSDTKQIRAVYIACNTISSTAFDLVNKYFEHSRVVNIIEATCANPTLINAVPKSTLVLATSRTVNSKTYQKHLGDKLFRSIALPNQIITLIENYEFASDEIKNILFKSLKVLKKTKPNFENLILGCTHYSYIENTIKDVCSQLGYPRVKIIDSSKQAGIFLKLDSCVGFEKSAECKKGAKDEFITTAKDPDTLQNFRRFVNFMSNGDQ